MTRERETEKRGGSWISILLATALGLVLLAGLMVVTLGYLGPVVVLAVGIFGVAALHYLVWGWWLSRRVRDEEVSESERANADALSPAGRRKPDSSSPSGRGPG